MNLSNVQNVPSSQSKSKSKAKSKVVLPVNMEVSSSPVNKALSLSEMDYLKDVLLDEKQKLIFKDVYISDEFNLNEEDRSDEVDHANADASNAQRLRFRNREVFYLKKLNEALKRMERAEYGFCTECEDPIGFKRLVARPTAELCVACKEESERDESHNYIARQSKSLGRQINLVHQ